MRTLNAIEEQAVGKWWDRTDPTVRQAMMRSDGVTRPHNPGVAFRCLVGHERDTVVRNLELAERLDAILGAR